MTVTPLRAAMTVEQCWQPTPGGSGTYIRELARAYRSMDSVQMVGLAARHRHGPPGEPLELPVSQSPLPRAVLYESWRRWRLPEVGKCADVVHATTWAIPGRRAPLVVTVHDLAFLHDPAHFTPRGVAFFEDGLRVVRDEAAAVIVPSTATRDACIAAGLEPERLHVVHHGVRVPPTTPDAVAALRRRHGLRRPYVLWVGTREPRKNLPRLLDAFAATTARGADLDLVLVGPEGWGPHLDRVAGTPDRDRLHVLGRLNAPELAAAYAGATVFCYPSLREGFGMPVSEAMAHGIPVVTSQGTSMEEVAAGAAVLVDPLDPADISRGLIEASGPQHAGLARLSLTRAAELDWARAARQTVQVLQLAAGGAPTHDS